MDEEKKLLDTEIVVSMSNATYKGATGPQGPQGEPGLSAYLVAVDNGFVGTEAEWLESLRGHDGPQGPRGENGKSAYEVAVENGFEGTIEEWLEDLQLLIEDGKSAYELAVENGFEGTVEEWLASLKGADGADGTNGADGATGPAGADGVDGKSAYEIAVENGFIGTPAEWLLTLRGATGSRGPQGETGATGATGPQGPKGDTPVKGVDYFTQSEINDFIASVPLNDYASKSYVETAIRGAETGLLKRSVVQSLPISDIDDNTIYMVLKNNGDTGDVYDEYLYINNTWEHIGSTDIDLTDYATKSYVGQLLDTTSALKRPLKKITYTLPSAPTRQKKYDFFYLYYTTVNQNDLFSASGDREWFVNCANYGFKEYPIIIELNWSGGSETFIPYSGVINYVEYDRDIMGPIVCRMTTQGYQPFYLNCFNQYSSGYVLSGSTISFEWCYDGVMMNTSANKTIGQALQSKQNTLTAGTGITLSDNTISVSTDYLTNSDILAIWNN